MGQRDGSDRTGRRSGDAAGRTRALRRVLAAIAAAALTAAIAAAAASAGGGAPTVETEGAREVGQTSATFRATVNPNGSPVSECVFEYGTSEGSLTSEAPCSYSPGELETPVPVLATVEGLAETQTYYFRIHAVSSAGESFGAIRRVTTFPTEPNANTEPPAAVGHTTATLSGFVTPDGSEVTECYFEWGTSSTSMPEQAPCSPSSPGSGGEPVLVQANISGLSESSVYYYRLVATNAYGTNHGGHPHFETLPSAPHANTEPAVAVERTSATLRGFVNPHGAMVSSCYFEWGSASIEEHTTPCEQLELGSGEAPVPVTAQLTGLAESTNYHFRLVAGNTHGTDTGGGSNFTTLPFVPKILLQRTQELSAESALMRGKIDPQGETVSECTFEYGTTPGLGKKASCSSLPPASEGYSPVSAAVSGLSPTTTYMYRIKATDTSGTNYSHLEQFTTYEPGLLPVVAKVKPGKGSSAGGNVVTIKGENLLGAQSVSFGETETTNITSDLADSLTVVAPPGVGTVDVVVTTSSGDSHLVEADHYTYGKPIVVSISPEHGPVAGGTPVTVTGSGFEPGNSGTTFKFGKGLATDVECSSSTTCTMLTPASSKGKKGPVKVQAVVSAKSGAGVRFTYE